MCDAAPLKAFGEGTGGLPLVGVRSLSQTQGHPPTGRIDASCVNSAGLPDNVQSPPGNRGVFVQHEHDQVRQRLMWARPVVGRQALERRLAALVHNLRSGGSGGPPEVSGEPSRDGHAEGGHAVEDLAADPGLDRLCRQSPGAERSAGDGLVAQHPGLEERAPAVADGLLPSQSALGGDHVFRLRNVTPFRRPILARLGVRNRQGTSRLTRRRAWSVFNDDWLSKATPIHNPPQACIASKAAP